MAATAITLAALPFSTRGSNGESRQPATAPLPGGDLSGLKPASSNATPTTSTTVPIGFLAGPSTTITPAPVLIAVPEPKPANLLEGTASFKVLPLPWRNLPTPCIAQEGTIPPGTKLKVTNLGNSQSTNCVVAMQLQLPQGQVLTMADSVFMEVADLIESPIHVRLSW